MPKTHAFRLLRRTLRQALRPDVEDQAAPRAGHRATRLTRRAFVERAALAAGGLAGAQLGIAACRPELRPTRSSARIAIVGGGLAGLLCAHRLDQAGVVAAVYEASSRVGGRIWTARGKLEAGQIAELGGEFIDSQHRTLLALAPELDLQLDDLTPPPGIRENTFVFGGTQLSEAALVAAFRPLASRMQAALETTRHDPSAFARLDAQSLAVWLDAQPELDAVLKQLLNIAYVGEYGLPAEEQSVFNLLNLIDSETPDPFRIFGDSDERFHAHLGNDQFPLRLAAKLGERVQLGQHLTRVRELAGKYRLSFEREGASVEHDFDTVVLAIPFSVLRHVELDLELPPLKRQIIRELGYGTNAKLFGQFQSRVWLERHKASGASISDLPSQATWDSSRGQPGNAGVMTVFLGGEAGLRAGAGSAEEQVLGVLPHLDTIFPGTRAAYREGSALRMHWPSMPLARGSYTCYRPGQAAWSGREGERLGRLHFCGEHTSVDFQGYMEGAAESGERVAREVLSDLQVPLPAALRVSAG